MHKSSGIVGVEFRYEFSREPAAQLRNTFFDVLGAVRHEGSIAAAARTLGVSYRYLWGYLKDEETRLDRALVHWDKGRAARLTEFAEKLLWAETRIRARLAPQIENLAADIGRELSSAFNDDVRIVRCVASHDLSLPLLKRLCQDRELLLDLRFEGSVAALHELNVGRCALAGIHLPLSRPELAARGSHVHRTFAPLLKSRRHAMLRVARRTQGLFVACGNPLRIGGLDDLPRVRFVNRAPTTGTRVLLDELLARNGIDAASIAGYRHEEANHLAVAAAVASGAADTGFGIQAAAAGKSIDFVPLVVEDYFLVCERATLETPAARELVALLSSAQWRERIAGLPGYSASGAGEVVSPRAALPWYR
jgi:putative molybdopterin biosynthesis protein